MDYVELQRFLSREPDLKSHFLCPIIVPVRKEKDNLELEIRKAVKYLESGLIKYLLPSKNRDYRELIDGIVKYRCRIPTCTYIITGEFIGKIDAFVIPLKSIFLDMTYMLLDYQIPRAGHTLVTPAE